LKAFNRARKALDEALAAHDRGPAAQGAAPVGMK
jgi:hypothetical protein